MSHPGTRFTYVRLRGMGQKTILVVEDEPIIRFALGAQLESLGLAVIEAESGEAAIEILKENSEISLVFTDIRMPGSVDGVALVRWIQGNLPNLPFLITSGEVGERRDVKGMYEGRFVHVGGLRRTHSQSPGSNCSR